MKKSLILTVLSVIILMNITGCQKLEESNNYISTTEAESIVDSITAEFNTEETQDYSLHLDIAINLLNQKLKSINATEFISEDMVTIKTDGDECVILFYNTSDNRRIRVPFISNGYGDWKINAIIDDTSGHTYYIGKLVEAAYDIYDYDSDSIIKEHTTTIENLLNQ